jgi:acetyl-CoA synthetase
LCDRHEPDQIAYRVVSPDLSSIDLSYGVLRRDSERLAAALFQLGLRPGDRIATLMSKSPALLVTLMAIWRLGAVHVPLFTAFAASAIAFRLIASRCKLIVCDPAQRAKLVSGENMPADPPWRVVTTGIGMAACSRTTSCEGATGFRLPRWAGKPRSFKSTPRYYGHA